MDRYQQYHVDKQTDLVTNTSMLSEEDKALVKKCLNKEWTNPKFKLKWFVGEQQITPFAKIRQWLLELKIKEGVLQNQEYEYKKHEIKIKKLKRELEKTEDDLDQEELQLEINKLEFENQLYQGRINDAYLERQHLIDLINEFNESAEGQLDDGRKLVDILDTEEEEIFEAHYWTVRLAKQAAMDVSSYGRVGVGNMEAICNLTQSQQTEVLTLAHQYALQLEVHQNKIRQEVAVQLGLPRESVPALGVFEIGKTVENYLLANKEPVQSSEEVSNDAEDTQGNLENVYRI